MRGFKLDSTGDVVVSDGRIEMVDGNEFLRQTVEKVVGTNKGEWRFSEKEGIRFSEVLGKSPDEDSVRSEIASALERVDETFVIQSFTMIQVDRNLRIQFTATNDSGQTVGGEYEYGA